LGIGCYFKIIFKLNLFLSSLLLLNFQTLIINRNENLKNFHQFEFKYYYLSNLFSLVGFLFISTLYLNPISTIKILKQI
jgi:hypothetical protein